MRWALFLLTVTGQCLVSTCHIYKYTFIKEKMRWKDAQMYCRTNHTDLAILFNGPDEKRLRQSAGNMDEPEAWIGLYHHQPSTRQWHWSLPEEKFHEDDTRWDTDEPNDGGQQENCVIITRDKKWIDLKCDKKNEFVCCDGKQNCSIVHEEKKWREAQIHCREKNRDLISGIKQLEEFTVTESQKKMWIGLFRDKWRWSSGNRFNFRNWESDQDETEGEKCASIQLTGLKKWKSADCGETKPFFCYDGQCLVSTCHNYKYTFIKEKMRWKDAQMYCRTNHTDLAILFNGPDEKRLRQSAGNMDEPEAWIGLYHHQPSTRQWHWSLPEETFHEDDTRWDTDEPNGGGQQENCVIITRDKKWIDLKCDKKNEFVCCDGKQNCSIVHEEKKWREAQIHCREKNRDLISGIKQLEEFTVTESQKKMWIGLFRDKWRWSSGNRFNFRNWESDQDETEGEKCASIQLTGLKKWKSADCGETKPFFCYDDGMILIRENKTWEDAWIYCRENYEDLVSITDARQLELIAARAKMADTDHVWLGLRYSCTLDLWFWVTGERFSYNRFDSNQESNRCNAAIAMEMGGGHMWFQRDDDEKLNFICIK
ncbi:macrophage mannose receptor 1 isoform X2 [Scophthalmus maximus]|uniref:macrophage mannose receptor 1 isoform X2 n=1 Tax=Scophthalmus maximus TaxID=52904 RepID=UPI001FA8CDF7|nr:macrophage mannose receptor 1 isoform X2 [Scophthalmus maximus]